MGKYSNDCGSSYSANRSSGYNQNRSRSCETGCKASSENSARCRGYESEYARRPYSPCGKNEYTDRASCKEKNREPETASCNDSKYEYTDRTSDRSCAGKYEYTDRSSDCSCAGKYEYADHSSDSCHDSGYTDSCYIRRSSAYCDRSDDSCCSCPAELHLHEVQGSTQVASDGCEAHSHRFAAVTSEPVLLRDGRHAHKLTFRTDTYDGHCHEFCGMTTGEYEICSGHVHYCEGKTSGQDGHCHEFRFITHIENPMEQ